MEQIPCEKCRKLCEELGISGAQGKRYLVCTHREEEKEMMLWAIDFPAVSVVHERGRVPFRGTYRRRYGKLPLVKKGREKVEMEMEVKMDQKEKGKRKQLNLDDEYEQFEEAILRYYMELNEMDCEDW